MLSMRTGVATLLAGVVSAPWAAPANAQSPFLFTVAPNISVRVVTTVDAGYNARAFEPVAGERLEPRGSIVATLSPVFSVEASVAAASTLDHHTRLSDQMEVTATPLRRGALAFGSALGFRREYSGANVALARALGQRVTERSALVADVLLEHPFVSGRDAVDVITTVGAARALTPRVWLGAEAVGSDLEGFWSAEEAEGGATLLIGPTLAVGVTDRWRLVIGGGPVFRATSNRTLTTQVGPAPLIPSGRTGYVLRTSLRRSW